MGNPLYYLQSGIMWVLYLIALIATVVMVVDIVLLVKRRHADNLAGVADGIDIMLAVAALMPVVACSIPFFGLMRAATSIAVSGTKDPRIIAIGFIEFLIPVMFAVGKFFAFFLAWLIFRIVHRRFMREQVKAL